MQEYGGRRSRPQRRDGMFLLDFLFHPELVEGCVKSQIPIETSGTKERVVVLAQRFFLSFAVRTIEQQIKHHP